MTTIFYEGKVVLVLDKGLLYDGKIESIKFEDGTLQYLVHYIGWNKRYDEWVGTDRILEKNEENMKKKKQLKEFTELTEKKYYKIRTRKIR